MWLVVWDDLISVTTILQVSNLRKPIYDVFIVLSIHEIFSW